MYDSFENIRIYRIKSLNQESLIFGLYIYYTTHVLRKLGYFLFLSNIHYFVR